VSDGAQDLPRWITSLPRTMSSLAPVLKPLKRFVSEEVKKSHANDVAKGIRDFQMEPYQSIKSKNSRKRKRNDHRSDSTDRPKRYRIPEQIRSQDPLTECQFSPRARSEVRLAKQKTREQASRTVHTISIGTERHGTQGEIETKRLV
jgi:hypothetical protein